MLRAVSVVVNRGEAVGIVGPNGSGKSTLLRIAAGDLEADAGAVATPPGSRVAYLRQSVQATPGETAAGLFPSLFPGAAGRALEALGGRLAAGEDAPGLVEEYDRMLDAASRAGAARDTLEALGVAGIPGEAELARLSGGEQAKLALAAVMTSGADVLLLDEPTNHLDLAAIRWLEERLAAFEGAVLLVSHDRALLDAVAGALLVLDAEGGTPELFAGGYSDWIEERERRRAEQWAAFGRQQRAERRLKEHISQIESRSRYIENSTINFAIRKKAKKIARRSTTLKRRLEREAASAERITRPEDRPHGIGAAFHEAGRSASRLVELVGIELAPSGTRLLGGLDLALERGDRIALVGPNGSGKTTLLRAILGRHDPARGSISVAGSARIGYLAQEDALDHLLDLTPVEAVRREAGVSQVDASNFVHRVLLGHDQARTPLRRLSFGERRRLALSLLMLQGANVLLLDEPTNHLDLESREAVETALADFEGAQLVVTHDRYLIASLAGKVWSVEDGGVVPRSPEEVV
ncbi:MAG: ABC-F family ATP-binding cassette domain-containing protein [Dehalococcoidia bacterium]